MARALAALPTRNTAIRPISSSRRGSRAPNTAISGAPTTTPMAYAEITCPAVGMETPDPGGELGQQPHRDELGGPDREAAHRQREQRQPDCSGDPWRAASCRRSRR